MNAVPWQRALLVWMMIMTVETVLGMAREVFVAPVIGDVRARQLGVLVGSLMIVGVARLTARWLNARERRTQWIVGAFWVVLTVVFEMTLGRALGASWERILSDYNPGRGGFMTAGLVVMFFAPMLAAKWDGTSRRDA
jgi:hypothetical protein